VYIECKTVITVEFPNAKYRRKQIKVHLNLPVEKMGHLYRVIKQLKLWNGFVVQHIDNMILTWNIMFRKYINISYNKMT
jgi:hypothetical protein